MGNVGKQQPSVMANIDPVTGQCVPGTFWNGVACVAPMDNGGIPLPEPIFVQEVEPIIDVPFEPVYTPPVYDPGIIGKQQPPVYDPPVYDPPPTLAPPIDVEPIYDYGEPVTQFCTEGYTLLNGQCVRSTRPYEPQVCPPGYTYHPVSGDCVPVQQGTDIITVTAEPTATPTNTTTPTTPAASTNPLASLLDANGKLFGFDPLIVGLAAAGVVVLFILKD